MFMTQRMAELTLGKPFGTDQFWEWVESSDEGPWLYVRVKFGRGGIREPGSRIFILSDFDTLGIIVEESWEAFWIDRVTFVVSDKEDQGSGLQTHLVTGLEVAVDRGTLSRLHIFTFADGTQYIEGHYDNIDAIEDKRLIYSAERDTRTLSTS
ncbi:hypothetical protein RE428_30660 [Marinobacter nanhaiticus D15-8W]|uniref:Uncharacterized protein n=1 Tax=Marinobacter nanhaiticus D15-8W TaxID=626887 RepID=N6X0J1_9GAMM|nr:hypothetical protein [Marinobacter nanhaiticus]ENO16957.1 hypothetical protein J057_00919 [Marinobacter nanhaiticus D15-8W]BES72048.1 hypothetical protein RE428_30660 [Marinobacter nanhaiticus D15-8W]